MDTFVVRTVLVPCTVVLLGKWNWWPSTLRMVPEAPAPAPDTVAASAEALGLTDVSEAPAAETSAAPDAPDVPAAPAAPSAPAASDVSEASDASGAPATSEPGPRRWPPRLPGRGK
jgi:RND superfamily putative drug exporter